MQWNQAEYSKEAEIHSNYDWIYRDLNCEKGGKRDKLSKMWGKGLWMKNRLKNVNKWAENCYQALAHSIKLPKPPKTLATITQSIHTCSSYLNPFLIAARAHTKSILVYHTKIFSFLYRHASTQQQKKKERKKIKMNWKKSRPIQKKKQT